MAGMNCARNYYINFAFFVLLNIEATKSLGNKNFECTQSGPCRCIQRDEGVIDLSPLEKIHNPRFGFLVAPTSNVLYFYHPCSNLFLNSKNHTDCSDGCSLCFFQTETNSSTILNADDVLSGSIKGTFHKLADASTSVFQTTDTEILITYKLNKTVITTIKLECNDDSSSKLSVDNPTTIDFHNHKLTLMSPYSCFRRLNPDRHHLSGAAIFFIILMTFASAYFCGGILVLRYIKGATGTEMIPNYEFWVSVPGRVKNMFLRLIGSGSHGPDSYEKI